jgi:glycerate kinase
MAFTVLIAPDKFKGCLSAPEAAAAMARGVQAADPEAVVKLVPMADGGEGTVDALVAATGGSVRDVAVSGPLGEPVRARFGLLGDGETAALEMASASGLVLVPIARRDPRRASTRGTGELLLAAIAAGARRVIVGIGGSATNDGGAGLAQALGYRLLDSSRCELPPGGGPLAQLHRIDADRRTAALEGTEIAVACDVDNPLCGPRGASAIYGPQKGASLEVIAELDRNLAHFARIIQRDLGVSIANLPGAGAAGGLGGGLVAFASGKLQRGVELIMNAVGLDQKLRGCNLCLTAEGALDLSSAHGKTVVGVASRARDAGCPTIALAGTIGPGAEATLDHGVTAYFSICPGPIDLERSMREADSLLETTTAQVVRAFRSGRAAANPD